MPTIVKVDGSLDALVSINPVPQALSQLVGGSCALHFTCCNWLRNWLEGLAEGLDSPFSSRGLPDGMREVRESCDGRLVRNYTHAVSFVADGNFSNAQATYIKSLSSIVAVMSNG